LKEGLNLKSKDINFEYIEEFVDYLIEKVENDDDNFVTVIAKFDEAKEILKNAMTYDDVNFESLQIESPIMDDYCDEFVLSFWINDGVLEIGCEKLKNEEGDYTNPCGDVIFLFGDCSSKIIPLCEGSKLYFVNMEDECDCDEGCDCDSCKCCDSDNDMPLVLNVKLNLDTDEAEKIIRKYRNDFYKEIAIFKELLDF
jgi:hypothetical protein